jgi:predicted ATPase/DNA-binding SARP family transcriptional activator
MQIVSPQAERPGKLSEPGGIRLLFFGPVQLTRDGVPLAFPYDNVQALLVYLAVENRRIHRRSVLAGLLWPDQPEQAARHSLAQALYSLRRVLGDGGASPLLRTTRETVELIPNDTFFLDVDAFNELLEGDARQLEHAIAVYRGAFLETLSLGRSAAFEEWALLLRERLQRRACELLQQLTEAPARGTEVARACGYARRWAELDPLSEQAHRRAMRLLAQTGQRAAALAQFERCRALLEAELGVEPEAATIALYEELKRAAPTAPDWSLPLRRPLSLPSTRLIARESDLAALAELLTNRTNRLITITGMGGVGKTRLALHAAAENAPSFSDGVCYVGLASLNEAALLPATIAHALGVQQDARPLVETIQAALAQCEMLLVLDNCEHLLPATATLVAELLEAAPRLVVLATSRVALRLSHERRYPLAPLGLPETEQVSDALLAQVPAVALFIERAQVARATVELDWDAISAICRWLDGLPLAIELAAMRARLLAPRELLARLTQRLSLLNGGPRDLPERQQTLRATIGWSYELLDPSQQVLFRRLTVFVGGWTIAAAEAVCADQPDAATINGSPVLDGLDALLEGSLLSEITGRANGPRWAMLETIREYAQDLLAAHGQGDEAQRRHASYFVELAAQATTELNGSAQGVWLQRLDDELDNLRAALTWCVEHDISAGMGLATNLYRYWNIRGHRAEGRNWLETLLGRKECTNAQPPTKQERADSLFSVSVLSMLLNDLDHATRRAQESLVLYQQLGDQLNIGRVLNNLGNIKLQERDQRGAERYYRDSLAISRQTNYKRGVAATLDNLAEVERLQGNLVASKAAYDESLTLYQQLGDMAATATVMGHKATLLLQQSEHGEARRLYEASYTIAYQLGDKPGLRQALHGLGNLARSKQQYAEAKQFYRQSLAIAAAIGYIGAAVLGVLCLATIACAEKRLERAALLLGAVESLTQTERISLDLDGKAMLEEYMGLVRSGLEASTFVTAWAHGQALILEQAVALALDEN